MFHTNNSVYANITMASSNEYRHMWLQQDTYSIDSIYMVRHVKNNKISYQWLNVEQKNACLLWESVENSDAALPRTDF